MAPSTRARAANLPRGLEGDTGGGDKPPDKPITLRVHRSRCKECEIMYQFFHDALVVWKSNSGTLLIALRSQTTAAALDPPVVVDDSLPETPSGVRTPASAGKLQIPKGC
ncbi:hypothetical protein N7528_009120 [Penicillium herquei]|nr:hypothetical protein N7528_009120 [Penicillium herquei]